MDTTGNPTIGYGNNLKSPVTKRAWKEAGIQTPYADAYRGRAAITPDEALRLNQASEQITRKDAEAVYGRLSRYTPNQQIALADMSYQLGLPALKGFKNFNAAMKKGDTFSAVNHLIKSKLATQTPERVKRITQLLLS
jgi:GH24 family phage-related lysozyme (muramidase)